VKPLSLLAALSLAALLFWTAWHRTPEARPADAEHPHAPTRREAPPGEPSPAPPRAGREPAALDSTPDHAARIQELEAEVARLTAALRQAEEREPESAAEIHAALRALNPNDLQAAAARRERQRALLTRLVELHPEDPGAARALEELSGLWISVDPRKALEAAETHGPRVGLEPWRQDRLAANALDRLDRPAEAELAYRRVMDSPAAPEHERWSARFSTAYLFMRRGEYAEARVRFEALIEDAGPDPPAAIRGTVDGARTQLEKIRAAEDR